MNSIDDTIVAPATPLGEGGIAIVRVSGKASLEIADKRFHGKVKIQAAKTHTAHYGKFVNSEHLVLDDVIITIFRAPNSYTGEDVIEINCHGSIFIVEQIVQEITKTGARIAEPGEFTKRAFLNGKMDLSQAEAVADLIHSRTQISHLASMNQLRGGIHNKIEILKKQLLNLCSMLELELDFSDEGLEFIAEGKVKTEIREVLFMVDKLRNTFQNSKAIKEGINVTIVGKPNVGKSSIFNYLVSDNRAIVTEIPGTTRDVIREAITISGFLFNLSDTAGIRHTSDVIEIEGMKRSKETIEQADVIIIVTDIFEYEQESFEKNVNDFKNLISKNGKIITVINKIDLLESPFKQWKDHKEIIMVSAQNGEGMKKLEDEILNSGIKKELSRGDKNIIIINARHLSCINRATDNLNRAYKSSEQGVSNEFLAADIREAIHALEEITGNISNEDILNNIFSNFCVGK
jgi:tRNA modification GTPase